MAATAYQNSSKTWPHAPRHDSEKEKFYEIFYVRCKCSNKIHIKCAVERWACTHNALGEKNNNIQWHISGEIQPFYSFTSLQFQHVKRLNDKNARRMVVFSFGFFFRFVWSVAALLADCVETHIKFTPLRFDWITVPSSDDSLHWFLSLFFALSSLLLNEKSFNCSALFHKKCVWRLVFLFPFGNRCFCSWFDFTL